MEQARREELEDEEGDGITFLDKHRLIGLLQACLNRRMQHASKEPSVIMHNLEIKDSLAELDEQVEDDDEVAKTTLALKAVRQRGGGVQKKDGKGCFTSNAQTRRQG